MGCLATVIIPTYDHGPTIRYALASALRQTVEDIEVIIIGDGVAEADKPLLFALAASDARVSYVDRPKHVRRGEVYRHAALESAQGRIVCYLCDRDVWLPCHVERMSKQLESADFTHSLSLHVRPDNSYQFFPTDLSLPEHRRFMRVRGNRVAFSCAAHTMESYRSLPFGWRTTPEGIETDWYMFRQFLEMDNCRASSGTFPSAITFPSPSRRGWPTERRVAELKAWSERLADEATREEIVRDILENAIRARDASLADVMREKEALQEQVTEFSTSLRPVYHALLWQCRTNLARIPGLRRVVRKIKRQRQRLKIKRQKAKGKRQE